MTTDQVLVGLALTLALAVGSQILASRLHIPALIVLLPAGFATGALTDVVDPENLLGAAFQPLVLWAGPHGQRQAIREAGLELAPGELFSDVTDPRAQVEGVTSVFLLTAEDDFNALAATVLQGGPAGTVYRLRPPPESHGVLAADSGGPVLFGTGLTRDAINLRYAEGARIAAGSSTGELLFRVRQDGSLHPVTDDGVPRAEPGDTPVVLGTLLT